MGLDEERCNAWVQPSRQPVHDHLLDELRQVGGGVVSRRERVPVRHEEIALVLVLEVDPVTKRAVVVAQMHLAGRAHTGKHTPGLRDRTHSQPLYGCAPGPSQAPPTANPGRVPRPWRRITGGETARSTTVVGSRPQFPASSTASI